MQAPKPTFVIPVVIKRFIGLLCYQQYFISRKRTIQCTCTFISFTLKIYSRIVYSIQSFFYKTDLLYYVSFNGIGFKKVNRNVYLHKARENAHVWHDFGGGKHGD